MSSSDRALAHVQVKNYIRIVEAQKPWYEQTRQPLLSETRYRHAKRFLDVTVCLAALPFVLFILAICWIAIRLDSPGAAFFTQLRTGKGGRRFKMLKLRTMVINAAELKEKYAHLNELTYPDFKITNDPRITRVGKILRKTSID